MQIYACIRAGTPTVYNYQDITDKLFTVVIVPCGGSTVGVGVVAEVVVDTCSAWVGVYRPVTRGVVACSAEEGGVEVVAVSSVVIFLLDLQF